MFPKLARGPHFASHRVHYFLECCACTRRSISNRSVMRSNTGPWIMLSQLLNDDKPALSWHHSLRRSVGCGRRIVGFNILLNRSILGFTEG